MENICDDTGRMETIAQECDIVVQQLLEDDARLAQDNEADDSRYPEHRSDLIKMVKTEMRKRNRALAINLTSMKKLAEAKNESSALMTKHEVTLSKYAGVLREDVSIGLGCFVGGLLLGITVSIEPKWFSRR